MVANICGDKNFLSRYVNPPYLDYVHTIKVDNDCYGWAMLYAYTLSAQTGEAGGLYFYYMPA